MAFLALQLKGVETGESHLRHQKLLPLRAGQLRVGGIGPGVRLRPERGVELAEDMEQAVVAAGEFRGAFFDKLSEILNAAQLVFAGIEKFASTRNTS